jgi:outer membrane protein OmpA-like peptidoglycan-associated protein
MIKPIFYFLLISNKLISQDSIVYPVYFDYRYSQLDSIETKNLKFIFNQLKKCEVNKVIINAYCDDRGSYDLNQKLSISRAKYIDSIVKIDLDTSVNIHLLGKGELPLIEKYDIEKQRDNNRRALIKIYYKNAGKSKSNTSELDDFLSKAKKGKRLDLSINFIPGRHFLLKGSEAKLDTLFQLLTSNNRKILIEGHISGEKGDSDGFDEDTNEKKLSINRAKFVYDFLVGKGIDKTRLKYKGMRSEVPSLKGPSYDRRVEIVLEN